MCWRGGLALWGLLDLPVDFAVCFKATFLPSRSDERHGSGLIKAVGRWFESGRCVGPIRHTEFGVEYKDKNTVRR